MTVDVLTAFELNKLMVAKSAEVDEALNDYRLTTKYWAEASRALRQARAIEYAKGVSGRNQAEREAAMNANIEEIVYDEERLKAQREVGKEFIRARIAQLSALQSQATALREELKFGRMYDGEAR